MHIIHTACTYMRKELRQKVIDLRVKKRMSYGQIKEVTGVSKSTLSYWLRDHHLTDEEITNLRRNSWSKGEVSREKYRNKMRERKKKKDLEMYQIEKNYMDNVSSKELYLAGLMLYLGEGAKKKDSSIVLSNSDPKVIKFFIWWLNKFLDISKDEIRIQLHLYEDMDLSYEKKFWLKYLGVKNSQLYKLSVRKLKRNSFSYSSTHGHGTCSLYAFGVDRVRKIMMAIKAMLDTYE